MTKHIEKLADLQPDQGNANLGTERGQYMLDESISQVGAARSIVTDRDGVVIAGNKTLQAAVDAGLGVKVVQTDGNDLVVVQRTDLDLDGEGDEAERARLAAYFDNRASEVGLAWDAEQIAADIAAGMDFGPMFGDGELAEILSALAPEPEPDPGAQIDKAAELQEKWQTALGQVWEVGRHRVMCGDSTSAEDVARLLGEEKPRLVWTDPPYGVSYDGGTTVRERLVADDRPMIYSAFLPVLPYDNDTPMYCWFAHSKSEPTFRAFRECGWVIQSVLIWNKNQAQFGALSAHYKEKKEPFIYAHRRGHAPAWYGPTNEVTVWDCDRAAVNDLHPTQKPPAMAARAIQNSSRNGDLVLDPFLGSGTTIVACEQTGRVGYGMEIEPKYVAVSLERLAGMGLEPRLAVTI